MGTDIGISVISVSVKDISDQPILISVLISANIGNIGTNIGNIGIQVKVV